MTTEEQESRGLVEWEEDDFDTWTLPLVGMSEGDMKRRGYIDPSDLGDLPLSPQVEDADLGPRIRNEKDEDEVDVVNDDQWYGTSPSEGDQDSFRHLTQSIIMSGSLATPILLPGERATSKDDWDGPSPTQSDQESFGILTSSFMNVGDSRHHRGVSLSGKDTPKTQECLGGCDQEPDKALDAPLTIAVDGVLPAEQGETTAICNNLVGLNLCEGVICPELEARPVTGDERDVDRKLDRCEGVDWNGPLGERVDRGDDVETRRQEKLTLGDEMTPDPSSGCAKAATWPRPQVRRQAPLVVEL